MLARDEEMVPAGDLWYLSCPMISSLMINPFGELHCVASNTVNVV
jgi:hypothetical protein